MIVLDHIAVSAATLEAGVAHVKTQLGHGMGPGGFHDRMGTHNRLSGMAGGEYLEVIAVDPAASRPDRPRWFDLDRQSGPPRLSNWIARVDDLDAAVAAHPEAGVPVALTRGPYRWRMAVPADGILPFDGCFPALIQWDSDPPSFPESGLALTRLSLTHPDADALRDRLSRLIDDPRVVVAAGPPGLAAEVETPDGPRTLT
ncbi:MAG: VOC family protein [Pseudomonadota bacterium]